MFAWVKSLFAGMDRQTVAAERAAKAAEDIADMIEQVRDQVRGRLGQVEPVKVLAEPPAEQPAPRKSREK
jgi:methyl-accepting chemotaxis protein